MSLDLLPHSITKRRGISCCIVNEFRPCLLLFWTEKSADSVIIMKTLKNTLCWKRMLLAKTSRKIYSQCKGWNLNEILRYTRKSLRLQGCIKEIRVFCEFNLFTIFLYGDKRSAVAPLTGSKNARFPNMEVIIRESRLIYAKNGRWANQKRRPPEVSRKEGRSSVVVSGTVIAFVSCW